VALITCSASIADRYNSNTRTHTPSSVASLQKREKGKVHPIYQPLVCIHIISHSVPLSRLHCCIYDTRTVDCSLFPSSSPLHLHSLFRPKYVLSFASPDPPHASFPGPDPTLLLTFVLGSQLRHSPNDAFLTLTAALNIADILPPHPPPFTLCPSRPRNRLKVPRNMYGQQRYFRNHIRRLVHPRQQLFCL